MQFSNSYLILQLNLISSVQSLIDDSVQKVDDVIAMTNDIAKLRTYTAVLKRYFIFIYYIFDICMEI